MTNKEAIEILTKYKKINYRDYLTFGQMGVKAFDMAIKALEQEELKRFIDCNAAEKTPNGTCSGYGYVYSENDYYGDEPIPECEKCPKFGGLKDD